MREIKFRAWDKVAKNMFVIFDASEQTEWFLPKWKDRYEVMQYTGLKDRTGKEVYEGDIVLIEHSERYGATTSIFKIQPGISLWGYEYNWEFIKGYFCTTHILKDNYSNLEVIGNIYENPELIS